VSVENGRSLVDALAAARAEGRRPLVAEYKPTSPTTEGVHEGDPVAAAEAMVAGGAAALSVLTEPEQFGSDAETLCQIRAAVDVPVLRKDFLLEPAELDRVGADAVLVIARFVEDLPAMVEGARERGMTPLVEVHDRAQLRRALAAGADVVGVNNRDLAALAVDLSTVEEVAPAVPDEVTLVAESGIASPADADRMCRAGADGLLVGTAVMDGDPEENARWLATADDPALDSGEDPRREDATGTGRPGGLDR
jgi:indole-3-glycerol phosphate synthase